MAWSSLALVLRPRTKVELRPLDGPNGAELGAGYQGTVGDMIDAFTGGAAAFGEAIVVDASIEEQHGLDVALMDHPIETGEVITDHFKPQPRYLNIRVLFTDTPMETLLEAALTAGLNWSVGSITTLSGEAPPSVDKWNKLVAMAKAGAIFNVVTGLEVYKNMMISRLGAPRSKPQNAVEVEIELRQVNVIDTSASADDGTAPEVDLGVLGTLSQIDAAMLAQATLFLALTIYTYAEAYS